MTLEQRRVLSAIALCRTATLGVTSMFAAHATWNAPPTIPAEIGIAQSVKRWRKNAGLRLYRIALKRAWDDGTVAIVTSGIELLARLALLVPPPRVHATRYFGAWAPRSSWRRWVVPCGSQATEASTDEPKSPESDAKDSDRCERGHRYRLSWAQALAKVFAVDVTVCPRCGQRGMQQIAVIHDTRVLRTMQAAIERSCAREKKPP